MVNSKRSRPKRKTLAAKRLAAEPAGRSDFAWRILRFIIGLFLLPVCWASTTAVGGLIKEVQPSSGLGAIPLPAWAFLGGFALWLLIYYTLTRPVRTYVLGHELTHALWGALMGEKVLGMSISKDRGSVTLSDTNFLITLAPYFFPLYTVLVIIGYWILSAFYALEPYQLIWLGLVGFTWSFHLTFTVSSLMQQQPDIAECGYVFSYVIIYLFNVLGVGLWVVAVTPATFEQFVGLLASHSLADFIWAWQQACALITRIRA